MQEYACFTFEWRRMQRIFERCRLRSCGERVGEIAERAQGRHCCHGESGGWRQVEIGSSGLVHLIF